MGDFTFNIKKVFFCASVFCIFTFAPIFSQESDSQVVAESDFSDSEEQNFQDESQIILGSQSQNQQINRSNTTRESTAWVFARMLIVLAIVLAIIYLLTRLLKRNIAPGAENDPFLRKVSSITLSPGKTAQIVTLIDKAYLVGVSDNGVSLLAEITDKELIDAMNLYADKQGNSPRPKNFAEILELFMPTSNSAKRKNASVNKNIFSDGANEEIIESLKRQSERLHEGDAE